ncbi:hypothetical protein GJ744_009438 [Endocarpon pusillum]|uniref:Uncharacterized protein n=1 Tax=Endocarpon pusillum TaxID=364733 RepID=A0A8H7AFS4_9EURO|nr:hypothetical protein GJ744_009438 [Endocarpon pusillum]
MAKNSTHQTQTLSSLNLGGGLIEIAALTALIGSTTAESLVLGNKGAAGLLWGTMSIFGSLSVIKACIAAATSDWLRETLGVRSREIDAAIGLYLDLDVKGQETQRRAANACGIACKLETSSTGKAGSDHDSVETSRHGAYAFDQRISGILDSIPESGPFDPFQSYLLVGDAYIKDHFTNIVWEEWIAIFASLSKFAEIFVLWRQKATILTLVSAGCWFFFFGASVVLQLLGLSHIHYGGVTQREVDIIAGQLPSPLRVGGQRRLILGAPQEVRHSLYWKVS